MKKRILTFLFSILLGITAYAQTPQSFNYQAVLRDASGNILVNQDVSIGIAILQGSVSGTEVFSEIQNTTTNNFGLTNLKIGSVNTTGFQTIDWADGPYFIQISVDGNIMGTSQLLSVPYALHAGSVDNDKVDDADADSTNELQDITLSGSQLSISRGSTVDLSSAIGLSDTSATNELQDISLSGTQLSISLGSTVDLSVLQDGTGSDNQTLTLYNNKYLQISNGNTLTLPFISNEQDGDKTNEIQTISRTGLTVTLDKNGGTFQDSVLTEADVDNMVNDNGFQLAADDGDTDDTNELQTISRSGLTVTLDKNGGTFQDSVLTETDVDNMVSDNGFQLDTDDGDTDDTNEIQTISRTGLTVTLDKNGGTFQDSVLTETDVDNMVSDNGFQLAVDDGDTDDTNEIQTISRTGLTVTLDKNGGTFQDSVLTETDVDNMVSDNGYQLTADDGDTDDTNEIQTISRTGLTVTLDKNGGTFQDSVLTETDVDNMVSDNGYQLTADDGDTDDTNELQVLSISNDTIFLNNGGFAKLPSVSQLLSINNSANSQIKNVTNPTENQDAVTKIYADSLYNNLINQLYKQKILKVIDNDGNEYEHIQIGNQLWFTENLRTSTYNDGTLIPKVTGTSEWTSLTSGAFCWYNNDSTNNEAIYGKFYNWYAVNTGKLCPENWRVPTDSDWAELGAFLGGNSGAGGKLKETGTTYWYSPNTGATNETGFSARGAGYRWSDGTFFQKKGYAVWWSTSIRDNNYSWMRAVFYDENQLYRDYLPKSAGFSIRCVRNAQ